MATTQVTDEAMMAASMSLFISDQGMLNAGISSVVFSNAVGATEGTLNLVNADTVTDEKLRAELKEEEEKNQDAFEAAADMAIAMVEEQLKRLSDPVLYANGQFTIGGITVDEEDMDAIVDSMVNEFDTVVAQHNLDAEQSATLFALLTAYQNAEDPDVKAQILQQIKEDVSPEVAIAMAEDAKSRQEQRQELSVHEVGVQNTMQNSADANLEDSISQAAEDQSKVSDIVDIKESISLGGNDFFADMQPVSGSFNPSANGVEIAQSSVENTGESTPAPKALEI